ncbi:unnamed protein product [Protopolystoma xenopodis]|uniref:Uncharacterized protein n=1 Tax=Protopolystoma xenopodis TaxID=117903 RepID=A0A3S5BVJ9_9PLAT|nr:unnamed protein product [Protopolystoma xenopodis]
MQNHSYRRKSSRFNLVHFTFKKRQALIDLIWPAFQHPCHDVLSCHVACLGREPPFTRISRKPISDTQHTNHHRTLPLSFASLRDSDGPPMCSDYIWCSGDGLRPESVLLPACRRILADLISASNPPPIGMALASRISFRRIPHHELSSALI